MKTEETTKDFVDPKVYDTVDKGLILIRKIESLKNRMNLCENASKKIKNINFDVIVRDQNKNTLLHFETRSEVEPVQIRKIFEQTLDVMEAIYYAEMNAARKEFNNLLKTDKDGEKDTKK